jgi:cytochrome c peroxidase
MVSVGRMTRGDGRAVLGALVMLTAGAGCSAQGDDHDGFSSNEWDAIMAIKPLGAEMPRNPYNKLDMDPRLIRLGQKLFFDPTYADAITVDNHPAGKKGDTGKFSCTACHDPKGYFVDTRIDPNTQSRFATSPNLGAPGRRSTPGMLNEGYYEWVGWSGRNDSLMMHGAGVAVFFSNQLTLAHYLYKAYRDDYNAAFPDHPLEPALDPMSPEAARFPPAGKPKANAMAPDGPFEMMAKGDQDIIFQIMANMGRVWEAYPKAFVTHGSAFEKYVDGDFGALAPEQKRGLRLFIGKAACNECHNGPILSDNKFHNIGVPGSPTDTGRKGDLANTMGNRYNGRGMYSDDPEAGLKKLQTFIPDTAEMDKWNAMDGQFRTPTLLNINETFPYFHTGGLRTLEEVVRHYNKGGEDSEISGTKDPKMVPLGLTDDEISDLVAFLKSLTGIVDPDLSKDIRTPM